MPPVRMRGDGRKAKNPKKTLLRLLSYMKSYIPHLVLVMLCIVASAIASTTGSENIGNLVDDYILPMVSAGSTDFAPLLRYLVKIGCIFAVGMVATFFNQFLMVPFIVLILRRLPGGFVYYAVQFAELVFVLLAAGIGSVVLKKWKLGILLGKR